MDFDKKYIHVGSIRSDNNIDNSPEILRHWLSSKGQEYHAIDLEMDEESSGLEAEESIADWPLSRFYHIINLREGVLNFAKKIWADYVFVRLEFSKTRWRAKRTNG